MPHAFIRTQMLIGEEAIEKLQESTVAVFGIGGVGTFVVEGLVRSGVGRFVLIDYDNIELTNLNRQIHATIHTIGKSKVEVMKERVLQINPDAKVTIYKERYSYENTNLLLSKDYTYMVDAIDTVSSKLDLIEKCYRMEVPIMSSMGAGNKLNPTMLEVEDIYKTSVCPLAKVIRRELRKRGVEKLKVVYSKENPIKPQQLEEPNPNSVVHKRQTPGSVSFVPSVAGLIIASEVVKDIIGYNG